MKKHLFSFLTLTLSFCMATPFFLQAKPAVAVQEGMQANLEPGAVTFTPPKNWRLADPSSLPASVKVMVVGTGKGEYPPSINLATEEFNGTLKQYLKIVQQINESKKAEWKDLGFIKTDAGNASLSQVDSKTTWGWVRMMHVILVKNGVAYILTAASLKEEFSSYYKDFFNSMKSLKINPDVFEMVKDSKLRTKLYEATDQLQASLKMIGKQQSLESGTLTESEQVFESQEFQKKYWEPYKSMLTTQYSFMNSEWHQFFLNTVHKRLIAENFN